MQTVFCKTVHIAKCHSTKSWIMSSYFPMSGFRETVCASTGDNRHNCAPTTYQPSACRLNAAVRLTSDARKFDHVTPMLCERHWLPVEHRITFKIVVMTYKWVHSVTPDYLADYIRLDESAAFNLRLQSNSSARLFVPRSKAAAEIGLLQCLPPSHQPR